MTFFRRLRSAFTYLSFVPYAVEADAEDFWTPTDSESYAHFMKSPTGQKLEIRCRNMATKSAVSAMQATSNLSYSCGWAAAIAATFAWMNGHRPIEKPRQEQDEPASDLLERLSA